VKGSITPNKQSLLFEYFIHTGKLSTIYARKDRLLLLYKQCKINIELKTKHSQAAAKPGA